VQPAPGKSGLEKHQIELERRQQAAETWHAELSSLYEHAKELGLVGNDQPQPTGIASLVEVFRNLVCRSREQGYAIPGHGSTSEAVTRLQEILVEEEAITRDLGDAKRQLSRIELFAGSLSSFRGELAQQAQRVGPVGWFKTHLTRNQACPFCGSESDQALQIVKEMGVAADSLAETINRTNAVPDSLEGERAKLLRQIHSLEQQLANHRTLRRELEDESLEASKARQHVTELYRFLGRVEQGIANVDASNLESELVADIERLKRQLDELKAKLDVKARKQRESAALNHVGRLMSSHSEMLKLERCNDLIRLVPNELTLVIENSQGRTYHLWEIGSGENWMGYHIAALLALHEHFETLSSNPVPSFLVIDQPTQVYFPARDDTYDRVTKGKSVSEFDEDSDVARARRIFVALAAAQKKMGGKLQIIVTEHADDLTWGGIDGLFEVENWREGRHLIPTEWGVSSQ
jgi:phage shock protein A